MTYGYLMLAELKEKLDGSGIGIEIGTERNGGSTSWLAEFCSSLGIELHTVDVDPSLFNNVPPAVNFHCMTGEEFLASLSSKISLVYLDNFDWMWLPDEYYKTQKPEWIHEQVLRYKSRGVEMSNINSQLAHMQQAILIEQRAAGVCVICFNNTWYSDQYDTYMGKGGAAIVYLLGKGFRVAATEKRRHDGATVLIRE